MCVVALSLLVRPRWPIIMIGNRDEFHARPSVPLARWDDGSGIIAGRDVQAGGTWLGVNPAASRIAVITNVRDDAGPDPAKRSRGGLVTGALGGDAQFVDPAAFNGFSLLSLAGTDAMLISNRPTASVRSLRPGNHAIANLPVGVVCPRADALREALGRLDDDGLADDDVLFALLRCGHDRPYTPGVDVPEQPFLTHDIYGTRCSTVVRVGPDGRGTISERRFAENGAPMGQTRIAFDWGA
ncbi:MAG: hypothetical protein RLZZ58_374 [Pseudomonadota bacterium]